MYNILTNLAIFYPLFLLYYFGFGYFFMKWVVKFPGKKNQNIAPCNNIKLDVRNSFICLFLSSLFISIGIHLKTIGFSNEFEYTSFPLVNFLISVVLGLFLLDTAIYFSHKWFHSSRKIFKFFHLPHHKNNNPTTIFATYNESAIGFTIPQSLYAYMVCIIPMSIPALIVTNLLSMAFDLMGHSGYNLIPKGPLGATVRDHEMHHRVYDCNYAPYFTFWDKLFKTYKEW